MNPKEERTKATDLRMVVFDVDGVLFERHFLVEMSRRIGLWPYLRAWALGFAFNAGWLPFPKLLRMVYRLFAGHRIETAWTAYRRMQLRPGCEEAVQKLRAAGLRIAAVSSGVPNELLADLAKRLDIDAYAGIEVEKRDGELTGKISGELTEPGGKVHTVERLLKEYGLQWHHVAVVVDDRNNLPLVERAALSIGLRPNYSVRQVVSCVIDRNDMRLVADAILAGGEIHVDAGAEWERKLVHACGTLIPFAARISKPVTLVGLGLVTAFYSLSEFFRLNGMSLPPFTSVTRHTIRAREVRSFAWPPVFLAFSCLTCLACLPAHVATAAIWVGALADTAAAAIGRKFGRHPLPHNPQKTFEGSLAFAAVAAASTFPWLPMPAALTATVASTIAESLPLRNADNLAVPLVAGATAWLMS